MNNTSVNATFKDILRELNMIYDHINKHLFGGCLTEDVLITIESDRRRNALGWYWSRGNWMHNGNNLKQINIVPEYMNRSYLALCETMLHECVHLFCDLQNKGGRSTYHNRHFKNEAEAHGLVVQKTKLGWAQTDLTPETKIFFEKFLKANGFEEHPSIYCQSPSKANSAKATQKPPIAKYKCPDCEIVIHFPVKDDTEDLPAIHCPLCQEPMSVTKPRKKNS